MLLTNLTFHTCKKCKLGRLTVCPGAEEPAQVEAWGLWAQGLSGQGSMGVVLSSPCVSDGEKYNMKIIMFQFSLQEQVPRH